MKVTQTYCVTFVKIALFLAALRKAHFPLAAFWFNHFERNLSYDIMRLCYIRKEGQKMNYVEPNRDKKKIEDMKAMLAAGKFGDRNALLFTLEINTAYRISDLRTLKLKDVLEISRNKVVVRERLEMKEQKTSKHNSVLISKKLRRSILEYVIKYFPMEMVNHHFDRYIFPSRKGEDQPLDRVQQWQILSEAAKRVGLNKIGVSIKS